MISSGYESDGPGRFGIRWWLYLEDEEGRARPQAPRRGVRDRGFHFARGGRVDTAEEAENQLRLALDTARVELEAWRHQPSHALSPTGGLIPLDDITAPALGSGS